MKTKIAYLICMVVGIFSSCQNQPETPTEQNQPGVPTDEYQPGTGVVSPGANVAIVKFSNPQQLNNVIVSHRLIDYYGIDGYFVYDTTGSVGLNIAENIDTQYTFTTGEHDVYLEDFLSLPGTSPYIPLADDYYLIDWKWQQLLPISATCNAPQPDGNDMREMADNHCFLTELPWSELETINQRWENPEELQPVQVAEIARVGYQSIDAYSERTLGNQELYNHGLSVVAVMTCIKYPEFYPQDDYVSLIAKYDSIQNLYKDELIHIINKNKLDQICVRK